MDLDTAERLSGSVPPLMRFGAVIVLVQCLAIFVYAASLIYNQLMGASDSTLESDSSAVHYVSLGTACLLYTSPSPRD